MFLFVNHFHIASCASFDIAMCMCVCAYRCEGISCTTSAHEHIGSGKRTNNRQRLAVCVPRFECVCGLNDEKNAMPKPQSLLHMTNNRTEEAAMNRKRSHRWRRTQRTTTHARARVHTHAAVCCSTCRFGYSAGHNTAAQCGRHIEHACLCYVFCVYLVYGGSVERSVCTHTHRRARANERTSARVVYVQCVGWPVYARVCVCLSAFETQICRIFS